MQNLNPVRVIHHLPGRTRLAWHGISLGPNEAGRLVHHLSGAKGINEARMSHHSGRLLVRHEKNLSMSKLLELVRDGLEMIDSPTDDTPPDRIMDTLAPEPEDQTLGRHLSKVGGVGGMLLYLLFRRKVSGPSRLATSPFIFNLMVITAVTAGYPNIKNGLRYLGGRRTAGHDLLLSLATLTVLFLGEGFLGLTVIWLVNVTDMVQALLWRKTRQVFPVTEQSTPPGKPDRFTEAARAYAEGAAGLALAGGITAGLIAGDFRRTLAVLLAANPSAAGLVAPAALTAAASRIQAKGVTAKNRRAVAALSGIDIIVISSSCTPDYAGDYSDAGLRMVAVENAAPRSAVSEVERLQAGGAKVAVLGQTLEDLDAMRKAHLAVAFRNAPLEILANASLVLPDTAPGSLIEARAIARTAAKRADSGLGFVRIANLTGLVLAGSGWLPPKRGTVMASLTSLTALLVALRPPVKTHASAQSGCEQPLFTRL